MKGKEPRAKWQETRKKLKVKNEEQAVYPLPGGPPG
jgi:hypothetical protein